MFKKQKQVSPSLYSSDFGYLNKADHYFDSACQTLRPQCVIDKEREYYEHYNACGGRAHHAWASHVDEIVHETRKKLLAYLKKSPTEYVVAFVPNTTYGINMVLHQWGNKNVQRIITSDIEHNSVFLSTVSFAQRMSIERIVCERDDMGNVQYDPSLCTNAIMLFNSVSNIDGRALGNLNTIIEDAHTRNGLVFIDAAQAMIEQRDELSKIDFDCLFGSAHKMYGPSLGFVVIKRSILESLNPFFIGGGMVSDVSRDMYTLLSSPNEIASRLEPGLQDWAAIVGFSQTLSWLETGDYKTKITHSAQALREGFLTIPNITILGDNNSCMTTWYIQGIDSHTIALMYAQYNIMVRSGYFCCHYYLQHVKKLPPLIRFSPGAHTRDEDISVAIEITKNIISILS